MIVIVTVDLPLSFWLTFLQQLGILSTLFGCGGLLLFFFSLMGVKTTCIWQLGSWKLGVFGNYFSSIVPEHFLRASVINITPVLVTEKAMAPQSSTLAWKIPWMEEPGRLQSMVSLRVGHDWVTSLSLFTFMHWRRKWQPTPVFLPGESQGRGSLVGCRLWGCTESDTTEVI